jgi:tRNA (cytosine49-C5)-methyltransferase
MTDGRTVGNKVGPRFDRVLLDAPCSGEARFTATDPQSFATWSPRKIKETSRKQIGLIKSAFRSLKPGGRLLYATCSFAPEENERVVARLLEEFPEQAELLPIELPWASDPTAATIQPAAVPLLTGLTEFDGEVFPAALRHALRILPDERYDGFFLALIQRHRCE